MDFIDAVVDVIWGLPLTVLLLGTGVIFTVSSGFFQFTHFGHFFKNTFGKIAKKTASYAEGTISPWEATTIAIGGAVSAGNIGGVASAIAVGGPGAIFWMWVYALVGMITKMGEVALALHYRELDPVSKDRYVGGPTHYMRKGLGEERGWGRAWKILGLTFGIGIFISWALTMQCYNASEAVHSTFPQLPLIAVAAVYAVLATTIAMGGLQRVAYVAGKMVPFMCAMYMVFSIFIIAKNFGMIPMALGQIFSGAFSGSATTGGFVGAAVSVTIQQGLKRSLYSNEAGWGTSPMTHATAITGHPIEQSLWGCFEVFVDTILVCSSTALVIILTGAWKTGLSGASLSLYAFEMGVGFSGRIIVALSTFLFALTTTIGWFTYYDTLLRDALGVDSAFRIITLKLLRVTYGVPGFMAVYLAVRHGFASSRVWAIVDLATGIPTFANLIAMLFLLERFKELLDDYKAKYIGIGRIDPEFIVWYEDRKKLAKAKQINSQRG